MSNTDIISELKDAIDLNYTVGTITRDLKCSICGSDTFYITARDNPYLKLKEVEKDNEDAEKIHINGDTKFVKMIMRNPWKGATDIECMNCHYNRPLKNVLNEIDSLINDIMEGLKEPDVSEYSVEEILESLQDIYQIHNDRLQE